MWSQKSQFGIKGQNYWIKTNLFYALWTDISFNQTNQSLIKTADDEKLIN